MKEKKYEKRENDESIISASQNEMTVNLCNGLLHKSRGELTSNLLTKLS